MSLEMYALNADRGVGEHEAAEQRERIAQYWRSDSRTPLQRLWWLTRSVKKLFTHRNAKAAAPVRESEPAPAR